MSKENYFETVINRTAENSVESTVSMLGITDKSLRAHLVNELSDADQNKRFLADPVFESMFPWEKADKKMGALSDVMLQPSLIKAMDEAGEHRFNSDWFPFKHQLKAWETLLSEKKQSVVVTSGTGSGKTECFMVPILNDLASEYEELGDPLVGVRALFVYPLNALINSQRERLRAWTAAYDDGLRFCLYNGNTAENKHKDQTKYPNEILTRKSLRSTPTPMLVTNATMLEYMLVRQVDEPIIQKSYGKLRWIVLDEAHSYIGSQAAELSLLLRRVMHTFGVKPENVRFIATSATIGDGDEESKKQLQTYLATLAGISDDHVIVIGGRRDVPALPTFDENNESLDYVGKIDSGESYSDKRYGVLAGNFVAKKLRTALTRNAVPCTLSGLSEALFGNKLKVQEVLHWIDVCSNTSLPGSRTSKPEIDSTPFLPLRGHLFHQVMSGLWCCADKSCSEKQYTNLGDSWPFGVVYTQRSAYCECGSPIYELVFCHDCNEPHLMANEKDGQLIQYDRDSVDEFSLDSESVEGEDEEELPPVDSELRFIAPLTNDSTNTLSIERDTLIVTSIGIGTLDIQIVDEDVPAACACCGFEGYSSPFRQSFLGTPFYISNTVPTLLDACKDSDNALEKPARGRRLITFTDSRQGTARISTKLQQDSERASVRGLVYGIAVGIEGSMDEEQLSANQAKLTMYDESIKKFKLDKVLVQGYEGLKTALLKDIESATLVEPIGWNDLVTRLQSSQDISRWIFDYYTDLNPELFPENGGTRVLAEMLLLREFARRPKRQNSMETLGLVSVHYPALRKVQTVPREWSSLKLSLDDWKDFLKVTLDFYVRENTILEIPSDWVDWMGAKVYPKTVLNPMSEEARSSRVHKWPQVRGSRSNRLIRLLCIAMGLDITVPATKDMVNVILRSVWSVLTSETKILKPSAGSLRYALARDEMAFLPCETAWVCPFTHRLIDTTFKGLTPYLPFNTQLDKVQCTKVNVSVCKVDASKFKSEDERKTYIRDWIKGDAKIQSLRSENLWTDMSDKIVQGGQFFRAAEHSAQQPASRLDRYEALFKTGKLNVLSCSTTMEMGVDIGGISVVAMNNVPPHPANYLQRAGRAGRRGETQALAFTICKDNPHERNVFINPLWPFVTSIPAPYITLNSKRIVQRHINSLLLAYYLKKNFSEHEKSYINLNCQWFFVAEDESKTPFNQMLKWLGAFEAVEMPQNLNEGIQLIIRGSVLAGSSMAQVVEDAVVALNKIGDTWLPLYNKLKTELEGLGKLPESDPYRRKLEYDIKRVGGDYLLSEFASKSFLPGYGFPTGIATFDHYSVHDYKKNLYKKGGAKGRIDNMTRMKERPGREISIAIREYAPGSDVILDGLVYRSAGILLNKFAPDQDFNEPVKIAVEWRCHKCGYIEQSAGSLFSNKCTQCEASLLDENIREFIEPEGFAVDFYSSPSTDISSQSYIPVQEPWVTANSSVLSIFNPLLGGYKSSSEGHIFHHSAGTHGAGFAICLRCGKADSMISADEYPLKLQPMTPHNKLQGKPGAEASAICVGSDESYAIKTKVHLGAYDQTDVFELYLKTPLNGSYLPHSNGDKLAWTLAVVLRQALADIHGVNANEMGYTVKPSTISGCDYPVSGIVLFDACGGGAGFSSVAPRYLKEMFTRSKYHLECPENCDSACQSCLMGYDTRFHMNLLDRRMAIEYLDSISQFLDMPEDARVFGDDTNYCLDGIDAEIIHQAQQGYGTLRIFLSGAFSEWNIGCSGLKTRCMNWLRCFNRVELVLREEPSRGLNDIDREDLWALMKIGIAISIEDNTSEKEASARLVAQLISERSVLSFGCSRLDATIANDQLWDFEGTFQVLSNSYLEIKVKSFDEKKLIPERKPSDVEVDIRNQFDGKADGFGMRVWTKLKSSHALLKERMNGDFRINKITYTDVYVSSPITFILFADLIDGFKQSVGDWCAPPIFLTTGLKQPNGRAKGLYGEWGNSGIQKEVFVGFFDYAMGETLTVDLKDKRKMAHDRSLAIYWEDGSITKVRFDQGMGSWSLNGKHSQWFDLHAEQKTQVDSLLKEMSSMRICHSKDFPTPIVISHRKGG